MICERKVVLDEFRGIGFGWVSVNGDILADGRVGPTNNALASGQSSQSLDRDTPDIEPQGLQASVYGPSVSRRVGNIDSLSILCRLSPQQRGRT